MARSVSGAARSGSGTKGTRAQAVAQAESRAVMVDQLRKGCAELVGTFALIYVGVLVLTAGGQALLANGFKDLVAVALAHGLTIAVMVSATMNISGGQLNPAVTLALLATGRISPMQAGVNVLAQLVGGVLGGLLAKASIGGASIAPGIPALANGVGFWQGVLVEAILTFFLVAVVFGTAIDNRFGARIGGLAIGFTVALDILAGGPITGAAMNPARWFGPALAQGTFPDTLVYILGPVAGGVLAGLLWHHVLMPKRM
jgi:aquaporin TIP